ncbi:MAG: MarR family winged helix-turn-helix transcriptional regulator [Thermoleophilia bacterium]
MNKRDEHIRTIVDDLRTVYANLHRLSVPAWQQLDLTMAQFKALVAIERSKATSVCMLGRELSIGESATSLLVDKLVRRGYVERTTDPDDRRRVLLAATVRGQELLHELRHGHHQSLMEWLTALTDEDLDVLSRGLRTLRQTSNSSIPPASSAQCQIHGGDSPTKARPETTPRAKARAQAVATAQTKAMADGETAPEGEMVGR